MAEIIKCLFCICVLALTTSKCEPPVNSYLPPAGGNRPAAEYGLPGQGNGDIASSGFGRNNNQQVKGSQDRPFSPNSPDSQYGPPQRNSPSRQTNNPQNLYQTPGQFGPSSEVDTQYGPPKQQQGGNQGSRRQPGNGQGRDNSGTGEQRSNLSPSYGPPNAQLGRQGAGDFGQGRGNAPRQGTPDNSYGPPAFDRPQSLNTLGRGGSNQKSGPQSASTSYEAPNFGNAIERDSFRVPELGSGSQSPQTSYGAPNAGGRSEGGRQPPVRGPPASSYGAPGFGGGSTGSGGNGEDFNGESDEPAKYEFSYDVDDSQTGTKFGHSEQRDGDIATGEYNVLLPDGRKQIVEYEAGLLGYKPQIRYEGGAGGASGFGSGSGSGSQGYPRGPAGQAGDDFSGSNNDLNYPQSGDQSSGGNNKGYPNQYQPEGNFESSPGSRSDGESGYPRGGPNSGRDRQSNQGPSLQGTQGSGYPRGSPAARGSNQGGLNNNGNSPDEGYPSGRPGQGPSRFGEGSEINSQQGNSRNQGYAGNNADRNRGGAQNNARGNGSNGGAAQRGGGYQDGGDNGYPSGGPQRFGGNENGGERGYPNGGPRRDGGGQRGGDDGYPSGGPNGPRGSGY